MSWQRFAKCVGWLGPLVVLAFVGRGMEVVADDERGAVVQVVADGESAVAATGCRTIIVGPGVNEPTPFPGYRGFVGWESPIKLANGDWIVGFNAGYWHASAPTPLNYSKETLETYLTLGLPTDIDAPTGGRALVVRSRDEGKTWSQPTLLIDTPEDDRHPAFVQMDDGTLLCSFFTYPGESNFDRPSAGPVPRVHFIRSYDDGRTWDESPITLKTAFRYDETDGPLLKLRDGSVVVAINGRPESGPPDQAGFYRSKDGGRNWGLLSTLGTDHDLLEVTVAELPDERWVMMARPEGDISWSSDKGKTWSAPLTFGMRMFAPSLYVLPDGTLICLHGSYAAGYGGLRVIFSRDSGTTWIAPAKDHGFLVDHVYGYGKAMVLDDGSLFVTYALTGGHRKEDARKNAIAGVRLEIRDDYSGIEISSVGTIGAE